MTARRRQPAFTLIELLVVVAIIAALLAIMLPSMGQAMEQSRRAVCMSNLHQQQVSIVSFAAENKGAFPPDPHGIWGSGVGGGALMMTPAVFNYQPYGRYAGQGILMRRGYLPVDGNVLYCPSFSYPDMQHSTFTGQLGAGFQAGIQNGGGWWPDEADIPAAQAWLKAAYIYRNLAYAPSLAWRPLSLRDAGDEPIIADIFNFIPAVISGYQHGGRDYMTVTIGGAAFGIHDPDYSIRDQKGGATFNVGTDQLVTDTVWNTYFKNSG